jgi:diaminopimelate decarboxylase
VSSSDILASSADEFGTPLYVYDAEGIENAVARTRAALPQFEIAYSLKANPSLAVCSRIAKIGLFAEIASSGELLIAMSAGFQPQKVIFAGPAKRECEIRDALRYRIFRLNVESERELDLLASCGDGPKGSLGVCLRINTMQSSRAAVERMAGGSSKFGLDEEILSQVVQRYRERVDLHGIHVYVGSQILVAEDIVQNFRKALSVFGHFQELTSGHGDTLIFGGGFGIPYSIRERPLDLESVARGIDDSLRQSQHDIPPNLILELGRFLVAEAGTFLTRVVDIKVSRGQTFVLTDGGINNFLRPAFVKQDHPIEVIRREVCDSSNEIVVGIGGPLSTPLDMFAERLRLPGVQIGDLIAVKNAGAYGYSMSMHEFLGHGAPPEVLLERGAARLVRQRRGVHEILKDQQA